MLTSYSLSAPALSWGEDGAPHSSQFDDVYFDKESGLEETRYVFLQHNQLYQRWQTLTQANFVIAETGFGTGLNFLCAWQAFEAQSPADKTLHFISVEKYPLSKAALTKALAMWPSLQAYSDALIQAYPEVCHGFHRIELAEGRIQLTLWFGEAATGFEQLNANVDAWFLDGFAPSKNPEMWSDLLFQHIRRLSHKGTSFATFTAAGIVRRGLQSVGFDVRKVKAFGIKREMAIGELNHDDQPTTKRMAQGQAWFNVRHNDELTTPRVLVVGSGLAGANTAYALAQRGFKVSVWEKASSIADAASGNPQGMLYPKLASQDTPINRFYLSAYLYASRLYNQLSTEDGQAFWQQCGLVQIPKNSQEADKFEKLIQTKLYPENILKKYPERPGSLLLPLSGWVKPKDLCERLLAHKNISLVLNRELTDLEKVTACSDLSKRWLAHSAELQEHFSHVILCTANDSNQLKFSPKLPIHPIRGQVSFVDFNRADLKTQATSVETAQKLDKVLCELGYASPLLDNTLHFGATYDLHDQDEAVREEGHQRNLKILTRMLEVADDSFALEDCQGRVSFRCAVSDYAPIVGPSFHQHKLVESYQPLTRNAKWQTDDICEQDEGLYLNLGHGSRGLISTPLSGVYLADLVAGTPSPLDQEITYKLHPARFVIRQLKQNKVT